MASEQKRETEWEMVLDEKCLRAKLYELKENRHKSVVIPYSLIEQLQSEAIKKYNDEHTQDWLEEQVLEQAKAEARAEVLHKLYDELAAIGTEIIYSLANKKKSPLEVLKYVASAHTDTMLKIKKGLQTPPRRDEVEQK